jgi:hypothetical protein
MSPAAPDDSRIDQARLRLSNGRARELNINTADVVILLTVSVGISQLKYPPCDSQIVSPDAIHAAVFANGTRLWQSTQRGARP